MSGEPDDGHQVALFKSLPSQQVAELETTLQEEPSNIFVKEVRTTTVLWSCFDEKEGSTAFVYFALHMLSRYTGYPAFPERSGLGNKLFC